VYALLFGQCSETLKQKLSARGSWETVDIVQDPNRLIYWHSLTECYVMFTRAERIMTPSSNLEWRVWGISVGDSLVWMRLICRTMKPRRYSTLTLWTGAKSNSSWWTTGMDYSVTWTLWIWSNSELSHMLRWDPLSLRVGPAKSFWRQRSRWRHQSLRNAKVSVDYYKLQF
jgi:hypothetical protein